MASAAAVHRRGAEFPPADRLSEQKPTESQSARSVGPAPRAVVSVVLASLLSVNRNKAVSEANCRL